MVTRVVFAGGVALVAAQRLRELARSRRNEARLLARGAEDHDGGQLRWMKLLHTGWLAAMPAEVFWFRRRFSWPLFLSALPVFLVGQRLRHAAMRDLGDRWTVRVVTLPGAPIVSGGIYRRMRHPNYLGVALEMFAFPLLHTAFLTSIVFGGLNAVLLVQRIRREEQVLASATEYEAVFRTSPRMLPSLASERNRWTQTSR